MRYYSFSTLKEELFNVNLVYLLRGHLVMWSVCLFSRNPECSLVARQLLLIHVAKLSGMRTAAFLGL